MCKLIVLKCKNPLPPILQNVRFLEDKLKTFCPLLCFCCAMDNVFVLFQGWTYKIARRTSDEHCYCLLLYVSHYLFLFVFLPRSFQAMEAPMAERGQELELAVNFYQFNRDVDDEQVTLLFFDLSFSYPYWLLQIN